MGVQLGAATASQEPEHGDGDGEDDDVTVEQHLYETIRDQVGEMSMGQQLELVKALQKNREWDELSEGLKDHFAQACDILLDDGEDDDDGDPEDEDPEDDDHQDDDDDRVE